MQISIYMTSEEFVAIADKFSMDSNLLLESVSNFTSLSTKDQPESNSPNNYRLKMLYDWFENISWATFHFCHLIIVNAKKYDQVNSYGYFLSTTQLADCGISENIALLRAKNSRRVCKAVNSIEILFVRTHQYKGKLFYVNIDAVEDINRILNEFDKEYREALALKRLNYPN